MTLRAAPAILLVMGLASHAHAETHRVPSAFANIQAALDSAAVGDTVLVAPGTYTGAGNRNLVFDGKDLVLISEAGASATILDIAGSEEDPARGVFLGGGLTPAAVLEGFTIINGFMVDPAGPTTRVDSDAAHDLSGAGIMIRGFNAPTVRHCVVRNCFSQFTGGGVAIEIGATPHLEDVVVQGCSAGLEGGGLSVETAAAPTLVDCVFTGNRALRGGGANFVAAATLTNCTVAGNAADSRGGGLQVLFTARVLLQRSIVWNNCGADGDDAYVDPALADPIADDFIRFECSVVDTTRFSDAARVTELVADNIAADPLFCGPVTCDAAPTLAGEYGLHAGSPALGENSPCGAPIGSPVLGCASPVRRATWARMKSRYHGRR